MTVQRIEVEAEALIGEVGSLTPLELDALPFGAIQLDPNGVILAYNRAEEQISGRRRDEVVGKNFFTDVAPCTRVRKFHGAFQNGVERQVLNEVFDFTFRFSGDAARRAHPDDLQRQPAAGSLDFRDAAELRRNSLRPARRSAF